MIGHNDTPGGVFCVVQGGIPILARRWYWSYSTACPKGPMLKITLSYT